MMSFKDDVSNVQRELSTKAYVEYSAVAKLVKSYGALNVLKAIKFLPLQHPNPIAYIIRVCSGKGVSKKIDVKIFNK